MPERKAKEVVKKERPTLESYQAGLTPEQFYFDDKGIVADLLQDKVRVYACKAVWGNILTNELWNIIKSKESITSQVMHGLDHKDSILRNTLNLEIPKFGSKGSPLDAFIMHLTGYREVTFNLKSGSMAERDGYKEFCKDLLRAGIVKDPAEKLETMKPQVASYKRLLKEYLNGGEKYQHGRTYYKFGWNEAERMVHSEISSLEQDMYKLMKPYYDIANAANNGSVDIRKSARYIEKKGGNGHGKQGGNDRELYELMFADYLKWHALGESIHNFRESDVKFDESHWDVFDKKYNTKKIKGKGEVSTKHPAQEVITHPLIEFTNNLEDKTLAIERRSGLKIIDPGVKTLTSFFSKVNGPRFNGDPSGVMDLLRLTISCEKMMGVGFLLNHNLQPILSKANAHPLYEKWKTTRSLFTSMKLNCVLGFNDKEIKDIWDQHKIKVPKNSLRGVEIKVGNEEQLKVKRGVTDAIYHLRRDIMVEQSDGTYQLLASDRPENFGKVEYIRQKLKNTLRHKDAKAAMELYGVDIELPTKEEFKHPVVFESISESLDMLEKHINASSIANAHFSFKKFAYKVNSAALESKKLSTEDFKIFKKPFTITELISIKRDIDARERDRAGMQPFRRR